MYFAPDYPTTRDDMYVGQAELKCTVEMGKFRGIKCLQSNDPVYKSVSKRVDLPAAKYPFLDYAKPTVYIYEKVPLKSGLSKNV